MEGGTEERRGGGHYEAAQPCPRAEDACVTLHSVSISGCFKVVVSFLLCSVRWEEEKTGNYLHGVNEQETTAVYPFAKI